MGAVVLRWKLLAWGLLSEQSLCGDLNLIRLLHVGPECPTVRLRHTLSEPSVSECGNMSLCKEGRKLVFVACLVPGKMSLSAFAKSKWDSEELRNFPKVKWQ